MAASRAMADLEVRFFLLRKYASFGVQRGKVHSPFFIFFKQAAFSVREKNAAGTVFKDDAQVKSKVATLKKFFDAHAATHQKRRAFFAQKKTTT